MPKGPQDKKRPADVIGTAVEFMQIATGEEPDDRGSVPAPSPAQQLGKLAVRFGRRSSHLSNGRRFHGKLRVSGGRVGCFGRSALGFTTALPGHGAALGRSLFDCRH